MGSLGTRTQTRPARATLQTAECPEPGAPAGSAGGSTAALGITGPAARQHWLPRSWQSTDGFALIALKTPCRPLRSPRDGTGQKLRIQELQKNPELQPDAAEQAAPRSAPRASRCEVGKPNATGITNN